MNVPLSRRLLAWSAIFSTLFTSSGCTRRYYREHADKAAFKVISQKEEERWALDGYHLAPDMRARFADDTNPDRPPMPPDDPAAKALSPNPQKPPKSGITLVEGVGYLEMLDCWDRENRAALGERTDPARVSFAKLTSGSEIPSPEDVQAFAEREARLELADPVTTKDSLPQEEAEKRRSNRRTYLINLNQSVELGLVNSREYQTKREQLYLTALPVTLERFAFTPQFYAAGEALRENVGPGRADGPANRWRLDSTAGFSQLFSTGGLLLLSFANRTVFNLNDRPDQSVSTFALDLIQPFLRGGGRAVTLEPLTQAERNLLYAVRDYVKFQQEFYVYIASGQPTFIPGVEAGVQALTGGTVTSPGVVVPGAFPVIIPPTSPLVRPQVTPGEGQRLFPTNVGIAPPQGFLSTLTLKALLVNQYRNIIAYRRYLDLFRVYLEGGIVNAVQVGQVEQSLLGSVRNALNQQTSYRSNVDQFKQQLGLPPAVDIEVDDAPLEPIFSQTRRYEEISTVAQRIAAEALNLSRPEDVDGLRGKLRGYLVDSKLVKGTKFVETIEKRLGEWEKVPAGKESGVGDTSPLDEKLGKLEKRQGELSKKREQLKEKEKGDLSKAEADELDALDALVEVGRYERTLRSYSRRLWEKQKDVVKQVQLRNLQFTVVYRQFLGVLEGALRERNEDVRKRWPDLPPLCVSGVDLLKDNEDEVIAAVTNAALENRLDLMNRRAELVDSWRKIAVAANALMGTFNVTYHYDTVSPAGLFRPLSLGGGRSRSQLFFNGELPLVRVAERNAYRAVLIAYQQQRRALQYAEDQVLFAVRLELRQLRAAANNYHKVQKRAVELAYQQVDQALQAFSQPQVPTGPAQPAGAVGAPSASGGGGDPAALTQQLISSQGALLSAQNDIYNVWINYITTRMSLYRDLGLMPLDSRGVWIDPGDEYCKGGCGKGQGECGPTPASPAGEASPVAEAGREARENAPPEVLPPPTGGERPAIRSLPPAK